MPSVYFRESKDIDCIAYISKEEVISLLDGKEGFTAVPHTRQDYVAFLWSDKPDGRHDVLIEIFCEQFTGKIIYLSHPEVPLTYYTALNIP
jgi:hypothetical protein